MTNFERWRNDLPLDFFKNGKATIFTCRNCPNKKYCPGGSPNNGTCWELFKNWAESEAEMKNERRDEI